MISRTVTGSTVKVTLKAKELDVWGITCTAHNTVELPVPSVNQVVSKDVTLQDDCGSNKEIKLRFSVRVTRTS